MPTALKLTVHHGDDVIAEETFERDIVKIGRLASAHLKLDDPKVSRIHAVIEATNDGVGYSIIDMGSTEGTVLNGRKISKERLSDGDELLLGDLRVLVNMALDAASLERPRADGDMPPPPPAISDDVLPPPPAFTVDGVRPPPPAETFEAANGAEGGPSFSGEPSAADEAAEVPVIPPPSGDVTEWGPAEAGAGLAPRLVAPQAQSFPPGAFPPPPAPAPVFDPWGSVPNNLASESVPDTERVLEVRTLWGTNVLDTFTATDRPRITIGDDRRVVGWGPFQRIQTCDIQVPAQGLPAKSHPIAESMGRGGTNYVLHVPPGFDGHLQRADGTLIPLAHLYQGGEGADAGDVPGSVRYPLRAAETAYLVYGNVVFQIRYIRKNRLIPPSIWQEMNYSWLNILLLAVFLHVMAIVGFLSTPRTATELTEDLFRNPNRFAQFRLTPEQKRRARKSLLARLKRGDEGRARGKEGKAGRKDDKGKKQGRMAPKGDKNKKDAAKDALNRLLGNTPGKGARGVLMGSGGLGGELRAALGGVSGRDVGDASGLGGLGTRGVGPGGGGLNMSSVGLGSLGTRGRGGGLGGSGYGEGAATLGVKKERDINISAGNAIIQGSLDKELIRRVIKSHIAQIRYCYERELQASPGLFGKVSTRFVISAAGRVQRALVEHSTLKNEKVERCVLSKIRTWRFPKPKGGGIVIVKYPFIFKTSG